MLKCQAQNWDFFSSYRFLSRFQSQQEDLVMASTNKKMSIVSSFKLLQDSEGKLHLQEIDYTEI